jgi:hypothetical protein
MLVFTIRVELAQGSDPRRDAPVVTIPRVAEATLPWMACSEQLRVNLDGVRDGFFLKGGYLFRL